MLFEQKLFSAKNWINPSKAWHQWLMMISAYCRDSYMHHTWKGIYLKFRSEGGTISNILYENILLDVQTNAKKYFLIISWIFPWFSFEYFVNYLLNISRICILIFQAPEQWAIWIGPAQQAVSGNLCNPAPCRSVNISGQPGSMTCHCQCPWRW